MSKNRNERLGDLVRKADKFFTKNDLLETVEAFISGKQFVSIMKANKRKLNCDMKAIEAKVPEESRADVEIVRKCIKNNFEREVIISFKLRLHFRASTVAANETDNAERKYVDKLKENISVEGNALIQDVCYTLKEKFFDEFIQEVYAMCSVAG